MAMSTERLAEIRRFWQSANAVHSMRDAEKDIPILFSYIEEFQADNVELLNKNQALMCAMTAVAKTQRGPQHEYITGEYGEREIAEE